MIKKYIRLLPLFLLLLSGCAIKIVPDDAVNGTVNIKTGSVTIIKDDVSITASASEPAINNNLESMVSSFNVEIRNQSEKEIDFDYDSFILIDQDKRQYYALSPEKVRQIMTKDTYYILPYPYVGFYYLEDYEKASFRNSTITNLPYYYDLYPQDITTSALPTGPLIPKAMVSGLLYFNVDFHALQSFRLLVSRKGTPKSINAEFVFPFKVVK